MMTMIEIAFGLLVLAVLAWVIYKAKRAVAPPENLPKKDPETGRYLVGAIPIDKTRKQCLLPDEWDEALDRKEQV